ncbi:hypothetical protein JCM3765_005806 [Sporobolomyces pararoseus]
MSMDTENSSKERESTLLARYQSSDCSKGISTGVESLNLKEPLPPASLSTLPPELLLQIIESTLPSIVNRDNYRKRQGSLLALSLVSKLFRSIAQPLLLETVQIKRPQDFERLSLSQSQKSGTTRHLLLLLRKDYGNTLVLEKVVGRFCGLRQFTLERPEYHKLSDDLTILNQCSSGKFRASSPLLHIESLALDDYALVWSISLLTPHSLPNLKFLSLRGGSGIGWSQDSIWMAQPFTRLVHLPGGPQLLRQVDGLIVSLNCSFKIEYDYLFPGLFSRMLFMFDMHENDLFRHPKKDVYRIQHLGFHESEIEKPVNLLRSLLDKVSRASVPSQLHTVYLTYSLKPKSSDPLEVSSAMRDLEEEYRVRGVDFVYDLLPDCLGANFCYFSEEFSRRQRERRELEGESREVEERERR